MARITLDFKAGPMTPRRHTADRAIIDSNLYPTPPSSPPVSRTLGRNVPPRRHYQFPESPMTPGNSPYRDVNGNRNAIDYPNDPFYSTPSPPRVSAYSPSQSVRKPSPSRAHLSRFQVYGLWSDSDMEEVRKREGRKEGKPGNGQGYLFYVVVRGRRPGVYRTWWAYTSTFITICCSLYSVAGRRRTIRSSTLSMMQSIGHILQRGKPRQRSRKHKVLGLCEFYAMSRPTRLSSFYRLVFVYQ